MNKGRLEAFSDGVFGVAITLLILDVRPEVAGTGWEMFAAQWHHILVYVLSFIMVGVYWVAHHHMLHFISGVDRILMWLNLALLLFVVFIPYGAALMSACHADPSSIRVYGCTLMLINLAGTALWSYASWNHRLMHPSVSEFSIKFVLYLHTAPVLIYGLAVALASWHRVISLMLFAVVPAFFILPIPWREKYIHHALEAMRTHEKKHQE